MINIQLSRQSLVHILQKVQKIIGSTKAESETTGVIFALGKNNTRIVGLSDNRGIKINLTPNSYDSDVETEAKLTTDFRKLSDVLTSMRDESVSLIFSDVKLSVQGKNSKFTLPLAVKNLPDAEEDLHKKNPCLVDPKELLYILKNTQFSSSSEASRPILSCIKAVPQGADGSLFVTTDGFRLSLVRSAVSFGDIQKAQIPVNFFRDVVSMVVDQSKKITISFTDDDKCIFEQENVFVWTKMVVGDFPPYERVLFPQYAMTISCDKDALSESVKAMSVMSRDYSNIVVLDIAKEKIIVRTKKEVGGENEAQLSILASSGFDEKSISVAFNSKYLLDYLSIISDDSTTLKINKPDSPVLFLPGVVTGDAESNTEKTGFRHIIMPVRISE